MNGRDLINCAIKNQEYNARRNAHLDKIYLDERKKLGLDNYQSGECKNPFIHISDEPSIGAINNITLTDSQFKQFMNIIKDVLK